MTNQTIEVLQSAMSLLAGVCDGASTLDGQGFNGIDSNFGKSLAGQNEWSPKQTIAAQKMLKKYGGQLRGLGIDIIELPILKVEELMQTTAASPAAVIPTNRNRIAYNAQSDTLEFFFPFNCEQKDYLKIVVGARFQFNGSPKYWYVFADSASVGLVMKYIAKYNPDLCEASKKRIAELGGVLNGKVGSAVIQPVVSCVPIKPVESVKPVFVPEVEQINSVELSKAEDADISDLDLSDFKIELFPFQRAGVKYVCEKKRAIIGDDMGLGKQMPIDTKILSPFGWRKIGDLKLNDFIIGSNGRACKITGVYPQGKKDNFWVEFSDGSKVEAGGEHLWTMRYRKGGRLWQNLTLTTQQLKDGDKIGKLDLTKTVLYLPMLSAPVQFASQDKLPIPAYCLGQMIANGGLTDGATVVTINSLDAAEIENSLTAESVMFTKYKNQVLSVTKLGIKECVGIIRKLKLNVVSKFKFIPANYKTAGVSDRVALLQGLMDGDGSVSKTQSRLTYSTISLQLAQDVRELVETLGGISSIKTYDRTDEGKPIEYQIRLRLPKAVPPFRINRKLERYKPLSHALPCRTLKSISFSRNVESVCIAVDAADRLYVTEHCILTHNTFQGLAALCALKANDRFLVICPASVKLNWERAINQSVIGCQVSVWGGKRGRSCPDVNAVVINYDNVKKHLIDLIKCGFKGIIIDELHYLKSGKAQRTQAVATLLDGVEIVFGLTGTPILNRPAELTSPLDMLGYLENFGGWHSFVKRYCQAYKQSIPIKTKRGVIWKEIWNVSGAANLAELNDKLRDLCMIRRRKIDVLKDLPAKNRASVVFAIDNRKEYEKAEKDIIAYFSACAAEKKSFLEQIKDLPKAQKEQAIQDRQTDAAEKAGRAEQLVLMEALKQLAVNGKMANTVEWINDFLETGEKLIVFANHKSAQFGLLDVYKNAARIVGEDSAEDRQANVDRFRNDKDCNLIVCSLIAGGTGIDGMQEVCSNVAFLELGWTPALHLQAEDRAYRIGQNSQVTIYYLLAENTIEEKIQKMLAVKQGICDSVLDGAPETAHGTVFNELLEVMLKDGK